VNSYDQAMHNIVDLELAKMVLLTVFLQNFIWCRQPRGCTGAAVESMDELTDE
jgi:hypothetical protein